MSKTVLAVLVVLGIIATSIVAFGAWLVWLSAPVIEVHTRGDEVRVSNVFLGEYYLGLTEMSVRDPKSGRVICHARHANGPVVTQIVLKSGLNTVPEQWVAVEPFSSPTFMLEAGRSYELTVRGNNGFGFTNRWRDTFAVPGKAEATVHNFRMQATAWAVTARAKTARSAPSHSAPDAGR